MTLACPAVRCRAAAGLSPADERDVFHCFGDVFGEYRERYGADYQQDACDQPAGQWFVEDGDADDDRHHGFERTHDRGRRRTDEFDGIDKRYERNDGGNEREQQDVDARVECHGRGERIPRKGPQQEEGGAEQHGVEGDFRPLHLSDRGFVHDYHVKSIGEGREQYRHHSGGIHPALPAGSVEYADTQQREGYRSPHHP